MEQILDELDKKTKLRDIINSMSNYGSNVIKKILFEDHYIEKKEKDNLKGLIENLLCERLEGNKELEKRLEEELKFIREYPYTNKFMNEKFGHDLCPEILSKYIGNIKEYFLEEEEPQDWSAFDVYFEELCSRYNFMCGENGGSILEGIKINLRKDIKKIRERNLELFDYDSSDLQRKLIQNINHLDIKDKKNLSSKIGKCIEEFMINIDEGSYNRINLKKESNGGLTIRLNSFFKMVKEFEKVKEIKRKQLDYPYEFWLIVTEFNINNTTIEELTQVIKDNYEIMWDYHLLDEIVDNINNLGYLDLFLEHFGNTTKLYKDVSDYTGRFSLLSMEIRKRLLIEERKDLDKEHYNLEKKRKNNEPIEKFKEKHNNMIKIQKILSENLEKEGSELLTGEIKKIIYSPEEEKFDIDDITKIIDKKCIKDIENTFRLCLEDVDGYISFFNKESILAFLYEAFTHDKRQFHFIIGKIRKEIENEEDEKEDESDKEDEEVEIDEEDD